MGCADFTGTPLGALKGWKTATRLAYCASSSEGLRCVMGRPGPSCARRIVCLICMVSHRRTSLRPASGIFVCGPICDVPVHVVPRQNGSSRRSAIGLRWFDVALVYCRNSRRETLLCFAIRAGDGRSDTLQDARPSNSAYARDGRLSVGEAAPHPCDQAIGAFLLHYFDLGGRSGRHIPPDNASGSGKIGPWRECLDLDGSSRN